MNKDQKTILRIAKDKNNPYVMMSRMAAQDASLSWKATGLLVYLLSLPDNWQVHLTDLATRKKDGISSTRTALHELIKANYIKKISHRDKETGQFVKHEYIVFEHPVTHVNTTTIPVSEYWQLINIQDRHEQHNELQEKILAQDLVKAGYKSDYGIHAR